MTVGCDFCGSKDAVIWVYQALPTVTKSSVTSMRTGRSRNVTFEFDRTDWRACEPCRKLIADGRREDLLARCVQTHSAYVEQKLADVSDAQKPRIRAELRQTLRSLQDDFWRSRVDAQPTRLEEARA